MAEELLAEALEQRKTSFGSRSAGHIIKYEVLGINILATGPVAGSVHLR